MPTLRPAVFLDRDGTLNVERSYITKPEELQLLPGVGVALRRLRAAGFVCVVVTNQSAIDRGMMSEADLHRIHDEMNRQLDLVGAALDGIYACSACVDHPDRKPAPGLLLRAAAELNLDLANSWMIGDTARDIQAGLNAGCRGCVLVRSGIPIEEAERVLTGPYYSADDLLAAADFVLSQQSRDSR